jgi:hypothetical protein
MSGAAPVQAACAGMNGSPAERLNVFVPVGSGTGAGGLREKPGGDGLVEP